MATYKLRLENPQQIEQLRHHLSSRVSGAVIRSSIHDSFGGDDVSDGHHIEIDYSGDQKHLEEAMHHTFREMGHEADWRTRFNVKMW